MQLSSMTGFARHKAEFAYQNKKYAWVWEFKSVNAKNMDVKTRLPQWLDDMDESVKGICAKVFSRGSFNVSLEMEVENIKPDVEINTLLLETLVEKAQNVYRQKPEFFAKPSPAEFLRVGGVVRVIEGAPDEEEKAALKQVLNQSLYAAAMALKKDRMREGKKIGKVLKQILDNIRAMTEKAGQISETMPEKLKEKVSRQIKELAGDAGISEDRLYQEALFLIMRADVKEEIDRLFAHIKTAEELLEEKAPVGRRLDFLCQELNREANTLCSKSMDIVQTQCGMALKALIEQFREQIQNME